MKKRIVTISIVVFLLSAAPILCSQEPGKLSLYITPESNFPIGTSTNNFIIGGGVELSGNYTMPFASWLLAHIGLDYSIVPTNVSENRKSLSLFTLSGGIGVTVDLFSRLNLSLVGSGGYGLGIYSGTVGGSPYLAAKASATYFFTPAFGLGIGAGYRHYISTPTPFFQSFTVFLGSRIRFGAEKQKANVNIESIQLDPVFPVFYKHYDDHPLGAVSVINGEQGAIKTGNHQLFFSSIYG